MEYLGVGQIAINVDDVDAAVADYRDVFGIDFTIVEVPELNIRAAVSDGGFVFSEVLDKSKVEPARQFHNGVLGAVEVRVKDLQEAKRRLQEKGVDPVYHMTAQGGMEEYYTHQFHGVPLTIFEIQGDSWLEAVGGQEFDPDASYDYTITWAEEPAVEG
jgi:predicted enzyme related to lactoylglutathione lyase